jgi:hypothetical protein
MREAALPLCPFPPLHWWARAEEGGIIDVHERWVKGTARNRIACADARGPFGLTIPVVHPGDAPLSEVRISGHIPEVKLWRAVETAYRSAPFFDQIEAELHPLWSQNIRAGALLAEASSALLAWTSSWIGVPVPRSATEPLPWFWDGPDLRERAALRGKGISFVPYPRVFMDRVPFPHGLSVLDALMHLGPGVLDVLSQHGGNLDPDGFEANAAAR